VVRVLVIVFALVSCAKKESRQLDHALIRVTSDARLRTDTVGDGKFTDLSTFVLVEAENTAKEGAYVTLGGELADESGKAVGELRAQSLWVPAGELRTFALVDKQRKPRPDAKAAKIYVRGAKRGQPPPASVRGIREVEDHGKTVVQAIVKNEADRGGSIMVVATFYDAGGKPMTRPFSLLWIDKQAEQPVQFVGPPSSVRGTVFIGDVAY
jgi:hypothetical protein